MPIDGLEDWFIKHPFLGILLMALAAGLLAHVRKVAQDFPINGEEFKLERYVGWTLRCTGGFIFRMTSAAVGALFVLWAWRAFGAGWKVEHAFLASGVVGMFSTEVFELGFASFRTWVVPTAKAWVLKRLGVSQDEIEKAKDRRRR